MNEYEQQIDLEFVEKNFIEKNKVVSKDKIREKIKKIDSFLDKGKYADYGINPYILKAQKEELENLLEEN